MIKNDIKISKKMKNKGWLSIDNNGLKNWKSASQWSEDIALWKLSAVSTYFYHL